jgi:hypothetical protein
VAEGIEQADELLALRDLGVHFGQGYFLARPATPPPVPNWPFPSNGAGPGATAPRRPPPPPPRKRASRRPVATSAHEVAGRVPLKVPAKRSRVPSALGVSHARQAHGFRFGQPSFSARAPQR